MNKRILVLLFTVLICIVSVVSAVALTEELPRFYDEASIIDDSQDAELLAKLDEISERQQLDVAVVTVESLDGGTAEEVADFIYDNYGFGYENTEDGVLLLLAMNEREWHISTAGYGITAFTDAGIEYIGEKMSNKLSEGNYYDAFMLYAQLCDDFITQAKTGEPYDVSNLPKDPFDPAVNFIIALVIGLIFAFVVTTIMQNKLKSVRKQYAASDYEKPGSMVVTDSREYYLYSHVDKEEKSDNDGGSSTHTSYSGNTHGGGGGSF